MPDFGGAGRLSRQEHGEDGQVARGEVGADDHRTAGAGETTPRGGRMHAARKRSADHNISTHVDYFSKRDSTPKAQNYWDKRRDLGAKALCFQPFVALPADFREADRIESGTGTPEGGSR